MPKHCATPLTWTTLQEVEGGSHRMFTNQAWCHHMEPGWNQDGTRAPGTYLLPPFASTIMTKLLIFSIHIFADRQFKKRLIKN